MTAPLFSHVDQFTSTDVRASTYPYGGGVDNHGIQLALTKGEHYLVARLPAPRALALAWQILATYDVKPSKLAAETKPLTPSGVAARFGVDPKTVNRWAHKGLLPHFRTPGGHLRFRAADLEALSAPAESPEGADA